MPLSAEQSIRYARQITLSDFGPLSQERLLNARVLLVGLGGLGCPIALYLASMGVGSLGLMDPDTVELSNLHRQVLYGEADCGRPKVEVAKERLQEINRNLKLQLYPFSMNLKQKNILANYDLVIDGCDQLDTSYLLNDACRAVGTAYLFGGVSSWTGQVLMVHPDKGPCLRCAFPHPPPLEHCSSCTASGVLGTVVGLLGMIQAQEAVRYLCVATKDTSALLYQVKANPQISLKPLTLSPLMGCPCCEGKLNTDEALKAMHCSDIKELTVNELKSKLTQKDLQLIDVREHSECENGCIPGAQLIPLGQLADSTDQLDPKHMVVCYCQKGKRGIRAVEILREKGFGNLYNLTGGYEAWQREQKQVLF